MPNKKGGKKFKRGKKLSIETEMIYRDAKENQEYARVESVYGSGRYKVMCFDGIERLGISAGNMKRVKISIKDIVLISKWEFQDSKCSLLYRYEENQVYKLKSMNEFPENMYSEEYEIIDKDDDIFGYDLDEDSGEEDKVIEEDSEDYIDVNDI